MFQNSKSGMGIVPSPSNVYREVGETCRDDTRHVHGLERTDPNPYSSNWHRDGALYLSIEKVVHWPIESH